MAAALRNLPRNAPVKFDRLGRELDEEGQVVDVKPMVHSTLKININREREERLKQVWAGEGLGGVMRVVFRD